MVFGNISYSLKTTPGGLYVVPHMGDADVVEWFSILCGFVTNIDGMQWNESVMVNTNFGCC